MNDGVLLLLVRFFSSKVDEINRSRNENLEYIYSHPDCGLDSALEWAEGEIELEELCSSLPRIVIDVAEGVDNEFDDVDHLVEAFDGLLEELPF